MKLKPTFYCQSVRFLLAVFSAAILFSSIVSAQTDVLADPVSRDRDDGLAGLFVVAVGRDCVAGAGHAR